MVDLSIATFSLPEGMHKQVPYPKFEHFSGPGRAWAFGPKAESYNFRQSLSLLRVPTHVQI